MNSPRRFNARGFTLAELMVGLAVTSIVMTAVVAIFIGVQRSYQAETEVKLMTENGRGAMLFLERVIPLAGYGLDPRVGIDVSTPTGGARDNVDVQGVTFNPNTPAMVGPTNTVVTDDLAFRFRDPAFLRVGRVNTGNSSVTVDTALGVALPVGKLLMIGCRGGIDYQMVRVATAAAATATSVAVTAEGAPFVTNAATCLQATGSASPYVYIVQEHRLRIAKLGGRPWLISFRDLRADVTNLTLNNFDPIAPDVEAFQVAFGMNRARPGLTCCTAAPDTTGNSDFIVGDAASETFFGPITGVLTTKPDYRTGYDEPERYTRHPANIRSVHLVMVMRSSRALPDNSRRDFTSSNTFNWSPATPARDGFRRSRFHTALNTPNLMSRSGFAPALKTGSETRDLNIWGG